MKQSPLKTVKNVFGLFLRYWLRFEPPLVKPYVLFLSFSLATAELTFENKRGHLKSSLIAEKRKNSHTALYPLSLLKRKYTFSPAELSSERGEKEVLADSNQPTAPPSTKSHVSYCAARARRREKMAGGTSSTTGWSLLQSVLVSAVDSCHCPHPSHPSTALHPIALSLSDQVWCIQRCDCVNCT